ncbi:MAG TPA: flagellar biosynthetic protein FliO [Pirellulaceae bacterium]|nr:flagellar biosynthetic protein FliO [Pirellulaceae bacterium]
MRCPFPLFRPLCFAHAAIAVCLAVMGPARSQTFEPRYEDPQVAPASFDRQLELTPRWHEPTLGANQQASLPPQPLQPSPGRMVCDGNTCQIEPMPDEATMVSAPHSLSFPSGGASANEFDRPAPTWTERIVLNAMDIDWKKMLGSLALVIGGYLGLVWFAKRLQPAGSQGLPSEVIEVIGVAKLDARHQLQLIRLGSKLLLVSSGPEGATNIGEITSASEVEHLLSLCSRPRRRRASNQTAPSAAASRPVDPSLALEQLVHSLQQSVRRTGSHAEFEA